MIIDQSGYALYNLGADGSSPPRGSVIKKRVSKKYGHPLFYAMNQVITIGDNTSFAPKVELNKQYL